MKKLLLLCAILFTNSTIFSQVLINDNFDSYTLGALGVQAAHWSTWSGTTGGTEDGIVSDDKAYSGSHSFKMEGQGGPQDVLLLLGNKTAGNYKLSMKWYVEPNKYAYFNLQKDEVPQVQFGQEIQFDNNGDGSMNGGGQNAAIFAYRQGMWIDVIQYIDQDNDHTTLFIDQNVAHSWQFSLSSHATSTPLNQIGALDFYATSVGAHHWYIDDVVFEQLPANNNVMRFVKVTVDMERELLNGGSISPNGIHIAGDFNGWDPAATPMVDNGDSTYFAWIQVEQLTDVYYKFINGNSWGDDEAVPTDCGVDDGSGNINRNYFVELNDTTLAPICFGACADCATVISGVENENLQKEVNIFPNPATDNLFIESNAFSGQTITVRIMNQLGQVVKSNTALNLNRVEIADLPRGVYFVELSNDEGVRVTKKFIKN